MKHVPTKLFNYEIKPEVVNDVNFFGVVETAKKHGVSAMSLKKYLTACGVPIIRTKYKISPERAQELFEYGVIKERVFKAINCINAGYSYEATAKELGVSKQAIAIGIKRAHNLANGGNE